MANQQQSVGGVDSHQNTIHVSGQAASPGMLAINGAGAGHGDQHRHREVSRLARSALSQRLLDCTSSAARRASSLK